MQTATCVGAAMIAATAALSTSAEAGRVRVSQEMDPGAQNFVVKGFVETIDGTAMMAGDVYDYDGRCEDSYGGTAFLPEPDAAVMAVVDTLVDTLKRRTLFAVYSHPSIPNEFMECVGPAGGSGSASMSFTLRFDDDDGIDCLVRDDITVDTCSKTADGVATTNQWLANRTDGFVLGSLDGRWQLDASFTQVAGLNQVIVRSGGGGDITGLSTDRTIRFDNAVEVGVDVQPGSDLGCLNSDGNGVIPVAILGGPAFDVAEIDTSMLELAGLQVRVRGSGQPQCATEDVNGDGHLDLACQFYDDPYAWKPGAGMAAVSGELLDSTPIYGQDSICIRPPD